MTTNLTIAVAFIFGALSLLISAATVLFILAKW